MPKVRTRVSIVLLSLLVLAGSLAAQGLPRATPEEVGLASDRLERLSSALEAYVQDERLPGAVALVARLRFGCVIKTVISTW